MFEVFPSEANMYKREVAMKLITNIMLAVAVGSVATTQAQFGANGKSNLSEQVSNAELQVLGTHISPTIAAHFTADSKWIVVTGMDGTTLHDAATSRCVHWFNGQLVEVAPDGKSILLEHSSGPPELWSIPDAKLIWRLPQDVQARDMHFSDDSQYIVCGYRDLLRIETREVVYRAPKGYSFDWYQGGDVLRNPGDASESNEPPSSQAKSILPYIYRTKLRHDARPLITPGSGLCSPTGRFMIIQTGEMDTSYEPLYSLINRQTEGRLLENVASAKALFFHEDQYVVSGESVVRTSDGRRLYSLAAGVTAVAINADQSMLAVGLQSGSVDVVEPLSGKSLFRLAAKEPIDSKKRTHGQIIALAFSKDSKRLAVVGSKLTLMDIPSHSIVSKLDIGTKIHGEGHVAFNEDGSRLLVTMRHSSESGPTSVCVHQASDLKQLKQLAQFCSPDYLAPEGMRPVCFSPDGKYAIVPKLGNDYQPDQLRLWDTDTGQSIADISHLEFQWNYREARDFRDKPKRYLGLGYFRNWSAQDFVLDPGTVEAIASRSPSQITASGQRWLKSFVRVSPAFASWHVNERTLHHPERQWVLQFKNYAIDQLVDLSTGKIYPQNGLPNVQETRQLDSGGVPETIWGGRPYAMAFSPEGSRLLMSIKNRDRGNEILALFEMPSGKLSRSYQINAESIEEIVIAPNNRIAAVSTSHLFKTRIIDLDTDAVLMELPQGGKCEFSPDSRWAHVGDRNGNSYHLVLIEKNELVGFEWAKQWSFSPNSRFAVGGSDDRWFFVDLSTGEKMKIAGRILTEGNVLSTKLKFPYEGQRFLYVDGTDVSLLDMNTAKTLATFNPVQVAREHIQGTAKPTAKRETVFTSDTMVTPDDQHFVYVLEGGIKEHFVVDASRRAADPPEFSTQVLIGDLETGRKIHCSEPIWSRSRLQHRFVTPDGAHLITISSDKMACWQLQPLKIAWETDLSERWTDSLTGSSIDRDTSLDWHFEYAIGPGDQSILIGVDGREAILFNLATGKEEQRYGPFPMNSVVRFGRDGTYLQVGFRSNQSMRQFDVATGKCIKTLHFTDEGTKLHRFGPNAEPK